MTADPPPRDEMAHVACLVDAYLGLVSAHARIAATTGFSLPPVFVDGAGAMVWPEEFGWSSAGLHAHLRALICDRLSLQARRLRHLLVADFAVDAQALDAAAACRAPDRSNWPARGEG